MKTTGETAVPVASSVRIRLPKSATFDCREQIGRAGGKFDGSTWSVTSEQLTLLREWAAESGRRFNKRDTQFSRSWAVVEAAMVEAAAEAVQS